VTASGEAGANQSQGEENREPLPNPWSQAPASSQSTTSGTASQPSTSTAGLSGLYTACYQCFASGLNMVAASSLPLSTLYRELMCIVCVEETIGMSSCTVVENYLAEPEIQLPFPE